VAVWGQRARSVHRLRGGRRHNTPVMSSEGSGALLAGHLDYFLIMPFLEVGMPETG